MALWESAQHNPVLREFLYHIPNGGKRNAREAARLKRMGVRAGVHDYHLPVPRGIYHSLYVELKPRVPSQPARRPTEGQREWRQKMRDVGNAAFIVNGWDRAYEVMVAYLALKDYEDMDALLWGSWE